MLVDNQPSFRKSVKTRTEVQHTLDIFPNAVGVGAQNIAAAHVIILHHLGLEDDLGRKCAEERRCGQIYGNEKMFGVKGGVSYTGLMINQHWLDN